MYRLVASFAVVARLLAVTTHVGCQQTRLLISATVSLLADMLAAAFLLRAVSRDVRSPFRGCAACCQVLFATETPAGTMDWAEPGHSGDAA